MAGAVAPATGDLTDVFRVLIANRDCGSLGAGSWASRMGMWFNGVAHRFKGNSVAQAKRNIASHYDLSNALFEAFLGKSWTYSCAVWGEGGLDEAQWRKIRMVLGKARVEKGCTLLDVGCGWGELCIVAAREFGCRVTGITLSEEQLGLARQRAVEMGVGELVEFQLLDYRVLAKSGRKFDRIVSVEMIEAVGHEYLGEFFGAMENMLGEDGLAVVQVITTPEERYEEYLKGSDFIQKYVFPGGVCPSLGAMIEGMGKVGLNIEDIDNFGTDYAKTLKEWRCRFLEAVEDGRVEKLGFDQWFIHLWTYYLCYCEAGFASRTLSLLQIVISRSGNVISLGGVP